MTKEMFVNQAMAMQDTLYRVSYGIVQNPHDQADAVQETIARALAALHTLREDRYFGTWLVRILINVCKDCLRQRGRETPTEDIQITLPPQSDGEMVEALAALDLRYRITILLHHIEGYTTREVARIMHVPEGTVKYRLTRGRALLKERLAERGIYHETAR